MTLTDIRLLQKTGRHVAPLLEPVTGIGSYLVCILYLTPFNPPGTISTGLVYLISFLTTDT